jgi:uncharacterized membrane protein YfcA
LIPSIEILVVLAAILALAHTIETCLGFGATIVALSLGAFLLPVETLLPALVVIGLLQSAWLLARGFRYVAWSWLFRSILPIVSVGLLAGIFLRDHASETLLLGTLGGFIAMLSALELLRLRRGATANPPNPPAVFSLLFAGGLFQGLFASGGPPIVYCAARKFEDPAAFRSTLAALWLLLNATLCLTMEWGASGGESTPWITAACLPGFLAGIAIGGRLQLRQASFERAVWILLLIVGIIQCGRAAM